MGGNVAVLGNFFFFLHGLICKTQKSTICASVFVELSCSSYCGQENGGIKVPKYY